eukprot:949901-Amorphochlora_amoeboformis.AAC.1
MTNDKGEFSRSLFRKFLGSFFSNTGLRSRFVTIYLEARYYCALPVTTRYYGKVISEQSPGSLAISRILITILSHCTDTYVSRQV